MRAFQWIFLFGLLAATVPARGADLNTPLNDKPTVGSEIRRGHAAALECELDSGADTFKFNDCVTNEAKVDEQHHVDYAAFELGLYWEDCVLRSILNADKHGPYYRTAFDIRHSKSMLAFSYLSFRLFQKQLGITDEQLATAVAAGDPAWGHLVQQLHNWEKAPPEQPRKTGGP